jgi:sigma-B regulation protein RsbU (phosphoserine phosphatase)
LLAARRRLGDNPRMSDTLFNRVLNISAFDGDSRAALHTMHAHFAPDLPDCSLALLLVRGQAEGRCRLTGLIGPDGTEHVANLDPNGDSGTLPLFDDEIAARIVATHAPHVLTIAPATRDLPLAQALFAPASVLAIPLANNGQLTHWLAFASSVARRFDAVRLDHMLLHVNLAASLIIRPIALRSLTRESKRQRHQIEGLADIQKSLLPDNPQIRGLNYAIHWQPAETAAGDYYEMSNLTEFAPPDFQPTGDDVWGVIVGDVSGHGAAAAMEAVQFDAIMRTYKGGDGPPPAAAMSYANRYFFSRRSRGHFMTAFAMLYRPDTRILSYLSAGHPPILHRRGSQVNLLGEGDQIPLGVLRDYEYRNNDIALEAGDLLMLYTDGFTEARDRHERMFGIDRLRDLFSHPGDTPAAVRDRIVSALHEYQGGPIGVDDQTLIVLAIEH